MLLDEEKPITKKAKTGKNQVSYKLNYFNSKEVIWQMRKNIITSSRIIGLVLLLQQTQIPYVPNKQRTANKIG